MPPDCVAHSPVVPYFCVREERESPHAARATKAAVTITFMCSGKCRVCFQAPEDRVHSDVEVLKVGCHVDPVTDCPLVMFISFSSRKYIYGCKDTKI